LPSAITSFAVSIALSEMVLLSCSESSTWC
jgi:hypothetical protein